MTVSLLPPSASLLFDVIICYIAADTTLLDLYFRFGRKPVMFVAISMLSIFSIAVAFAPSWPVFTVLFFIMGMGQIASFIVVFVLGLCVVFLTL